MMALAHDTKIVAAAAAIAEHGLPDVHSVQANVFGELRRREEDRAKRDAQMPRKQSVRNSVFNGLMSWKRNSMVTERPVTQ
jgi:hypothetical protein